MKVPRICRWLPLLAAVVVLPSAAFAVDMSVVLNEVNYHPSDGGPEWIEIHNLHGVDVDVSGWALDGAVNYTFPGGTVIRGRGYLVVSSVGGNPSGALGPFAGALSNGGETLELKNVTGRLMDRLSYSDDGDWPVGPDGTGVTLARRMESAADGPSAWTSSAQLGGTPGGTNFEQPSATGTPSTPVAIDSASWRYLAPGATPPANWNTPVLDDSAWSTGRSVFYSGPAKTAEPVPPSTVLSGAGQNLLAWWAFDDTLANSAPGGTAGTAVGADFAYIADPAYAGKAGKALRINVNASNVNVATTHIAGGNLPVMTLTNNFTWAAWVRTRVGVVDAIILGNRYTSTGTEFSPREFIKLTNKQFEWHRQAAGENLDFADLTGTDAAPSAWTHFAIVKTGASLSLYRNGVLTLTQGITAAPNNALPFFIGGNRSGAGTTEAWSGLVDDVALWTTNLPTQAITGLVSGAYTPATAPTVVTNLPGSVPVPPTEVVFPTVTTDLLTDTFDGSSIDTAKWTEVDQGLESTGAAGYSATVSGGKLTLAGTATNQYWYGKSLRSVAKFSARNRQEVSVDRLQLTKGGPATSVVRSSLWLWADAGHYVHFSQNWGETGWSYNSNDVGGTGTLNPTGGGTNLPDGDFYDTNGGNFAMKMVWIPGSYPGSGTVQMYLGSTLLGSQTVSNWPADFQVMLTGQARATGDIVSASFDNLKVTQTAAQKLQTALPITGTATYFRHHFTFDGDVSRTTGRLWPLVDDGAVFYLNGTEIHRQNLPVGALTPTTQAQNEVVDAFFPAAAIALPAGVLVSGDNVLAVEVHGFNGASDPDMMFGAQIMLNEAPLPAADGPLVFDTVRSAADAASQSASALILRNLGSTAYGLAGVQIRSNGVVLHTLAGGSLAAGATLSIPLSSLAGYADGAELSLVGSGAIRQLDSCRVDSVTRQRYVAANGSVEWATLDPHVTAVVINEIMYDAPGGSAEQWVEIYNKSASAVDLSGWSFADGIDYTFAPGTSLAAGGYLVVAWDVAAFQALHSGVTNVVGPFSGGLAGGGERIRLRDAHGNLADEIRYFPGEKGSPLGGGLWPKWAGGGGASLELVDPGSDNANPAAWADSVVSPGPWQTIDYTFSGANIAGDPVQWNEVLFGLLDDGEALVDDFQLIVDPGLPTQANLVANSTFESDTIGQAPSGWRVIGTHRHSVVIADPDSPGQKVLRLRATGSYEHMHNQISITLKNGATLVAIDPTKNYRITCRAKWLRGSNQFHTRLYFNKGARTTLLTRATTAGTPGAANSVAAPGTLALTFSRPQHSPAVPAASTAATVTVEIAENTQSVTAATLVYTAIDGGAGSGSAAMSRVSGNTWSGTIPGQTAGRKFAFSFTATGSGGANVAGTGGMVQWDDGQARLTLANGCQPTNLRIVMSSADITFLHTATNVMSNDRLPCTVIENERDIYYNVGVRLKGSERGRNQSVRVGFNLTFPPESPFRGSLSTITVDRSGSGNQFSQKEILVKRMIAHAGGLPSMEDDLIRVIAPQTAQTGPAIMTRRYDGDWLGDQFSGTQDDGTLFEYELIYYPTSNSPAGVENPKLPEPDNVVGVGVNSLGADKELYRWHWLIKNHREADDYTGLIPAVTAIGQPSGAAFNTAAANQLEVSEFLRSFAAQILFGVGDSYAAGGQHNMLIYTPPAGSGLKAMYFPWDMDFAFNLGATSSMVPSADLNKFLANPAWKRIYWAHVLDLCTTSFNTAYLTAWAQHYTCFLNEDLTAWLTYISQRRDYALSQVAAAIPQVNFTITTATGGSAGADFSAPGPLVTLNGDGWIDVDAIRVNGGAPITVTWTDDNSWQITLPIFFGPNAFLIEGLNASGSVVGSDTIVITGTSGPSPASAANTALSELMYNPPAGGAEFIELFNVSGNTVDFTGCYFSQGVTYTFAGGTQVPAGGRILIAQDSAAFAAAYPGSTALLASGGYGPNTSLANGGETLTLMAADGSVIFSVAYSDNIDSTDGGGRSLVRKLASSNPDLSEYAWRQSLAPGGSPGGSDSVAFTGDPNADADSDGYSALAEYAFGTSDANPNSVPPPMTWPIQGGVVFLFGYDRVAGADDAVVTLEKSTDLQNWVLAAPGGADENDDTAGTPTGGMEHVVVGPYTYPPQGDRVYFRLTVRKR